MYFVLGKPKYRRHFDFPKNEFSCEISVLNHTLRKRRFCWKLLRHSWDIKRFWFSYKCSSGRKIDFPFSNENFSSTTFLAYQHIQIICSWRLNFTFSVYTQRARQRETFAAKNYLDRSPRSKMEFDIEKACELTEKFYFFSLVTKSTISKQLKANGAIFSDTST